jgi:hypothetical protein
MKKVVGTLKKIFSSSKYRFLLLIVFPFITSILFFGFISINSAERFPAIPDKQLICIEQAQQINFDDFISQLSEIIKVPLLFVNFNMYALNEVTVIDPDGLKHATLLNINIEGKYTDSIATNSIRRLRIGKNIREILTSSFIFERSFKSKEFDDKILASLPPSDGSYYVIFLLPTIFSFIMVWLLSIVFLYGLIVVFGLCLKFIYTGSPIVEIFKDKIE